MGWISPGSWLHALAAYPGRHWRGELGLGWSFWVNGLALFLLFHIAGGLTGQAVAEAEPATIMATVAILWLAHALLPVWQGVGIWRAAGRCRREGGRRLIPAAARVAAAAGMVLALRGVAIEGRNQMREILHIAAGDTALEPYTLAVTPDGGTIVFTGAIRFGAARSLERVLKESPAAFLLRLESPGGRIGEAKRLRALIQSRGLSTYTGTLCASACAVAYLGGTKRYLHPGGRIGFHQSAFPGVDPAEMAASNRRVRDEAIRFGVTPAFAERAYSVPHEGIWFPSPDELLAAGYVTILGEPPFQASPAPQQ